MGLGFLFGSIFIANGTRIDCYLTDMIVLRMQARIIIWIASTIKQGTIILFLISNRIGLRLIMKIVIAWPIIDSSIEYKLTIIVNLTISSLNMKLLEEIFLS